MRTERSGIKDEFQVKFEDISTLSRVVVPEKERAIGKGSAASRQVWGLQNHPEDFRDFSWLRVKEAGGRLRSQHQLR